MGLNLYKNLDNGLEVHKYLKIWDKIYKIIKIISNNMKLNNIKLKYDLKPVTIKKL